jgi:MoxR-like ATPase
MNSAVQEGDGGLADEIVLNPETAEQLGALYGLIVESVQSVLYADDTTVQLAVGCLLAQGHLLVEDLPGLGKTTLAKAVAHSLGLDFHRVQFTADLLPADVTGAMVLDRERGEPTFRPGPIFTNVLMADELNRASARSQSALLEAMEERQVTADGTTMPLPRPFMVLATQNPFDAAGTSPLPQGQRDRFLLRLSMGYPSRVHEDRLLARADTASFVDALSPALSRPDLDALLRGVSPRLRCHTGLHPRHHRRQPRPSRPGRWRVAPWRHCSPAGFVRHGIGHGPALRRPRRRATGRRAGARPPPRPPAGQ